MSNRSLFAVLFLLIVVGCSNRNGAPINSQPGTPKLETDLAIEAKLKYESTEKGVAIYYPQGWVIDEGIISTGIQIDSNNFSQNFSFITRSPYVSRNNRRWQIPQPAIEIAQFIANTMKGEVTMIEPVTAVDINGRDGATFLVEDISTNRHMYVIILRISEDTVIDFNAIGPSDHSEEMKSILSAIALNTQPLDNE